RGVQVDGKLRASPHSRPAHAELEIWSGLEAHFDTIHHRLARERTPQRKHNFAVLRVHVVLARHLGHPEFRARWAQETKNPREPGGCGLIHAEHVHGLSVTAGEEGIARGPEPESLLAERRLPAIQVQCDIAVEQAEPVEHGYGQCWLKDRWPHLGGVGGLL